MKLALSYPEWQGCGENPAVYFGALKVIERIFNDEDFVHVDVPIEETLEVTKGVFGLNSIAPRFQRTIHDLRQRNPSTILMVGGTCGAEIAPVGYLNEKYDGDLAVVWLDAHGDLNTPESSTSGHFHGMALRTLLGEGPEEYTSFLGRQLTPQQVFLAGTRELDLPEQAFIEKSAISVTLSEDFATPKVLTDRISAAGFKNGYLHLDLDVFNPNSFSNSLMPTRGGPLVAEVQLLIQALAKSLNVVGFSVVEYCEHRKDDSIKTLTELIDNCGVASEGGVEPTRPCQFPDTT